MGLFEDLSEDLRAADAIPFTGALGNDSLFWRDLGYAFVLHGDPLTVGGPQTFPLIVNPKSYRKKLPFAVEITPVQEGGVVVEGEGVIIGEIQLAGNFGFAPKGGQGTPIPLSGQAHFRNLQDKCFGRFSELRQDPSVGDKVFLTFHSLQDNEHFVVEPRDESMERDAGRSRFTYDYNITLSITGPADKLVIKAPEDDPILKAISDFRKTMVGALGAVEGSIRDLAAQNPRIVEAVRVLQEAGAVAIDTIHAIDSVISDVQLAAGKVSEFLRGVKRFIAMPYETIKRLDDALAAVAATLVRAENLPADVVQNFRQMQDAMMAIGAYPEKFKEDFDAAGQRFLDLVQGPASATRADLDAAADTQSTALSSTGLRPGDGARVDGGVYPIGRTFPRYQGFIEVTVLANDTLPLLAARYLDDARRWIDIAIANELQAPYISDEGFPNTVGTGESILIPQLAASTLIQSVRSAGDPQLGASQYEALLGRDFLLVSVDGLLDLVVDSATGTDFATVAGVPNVEQAINTIVATEQGDNPLFTHMGIPPLVGQKGTYERLIEAHLAIASGVQRDPRVDKIEELSFRASDDTYSVDFGVLLIQNIQARVIGRALS